MAEDERDNVTPIDPDVRRVLDEFSGDVLALAAEVVHSRSQLRTASPGEGPREVILPTRPSPGDPPPPTRLGS